MWKWWRYGEAIWMRLSPPPWPWPDPGLSQDCCPLYHASPCWLWRGDCRYNADCSQCVFKDQNNNGICWAHSLTLIYHSFSVPLITSTTRLIVSGTLQKSKSCGFRSYCWKIVVNIILSWNWCHLLPFSSWVMLSKICPEIYHQQTQAWKWSSQAWVPYWETKRCSGGDVASCETAEGWCCGAARWWHPWPTSAWRLPLFGGWRTSYRRGPLWPD